MNEAHILLTLAAVHFVALMSPGPDFALVVQNAARFGRQTGFYIALGLSLSILLHAVLSITGVSYLIQQHPLIFMLLQTAGGTYLLYLGVGALRATCLNWQQSATPLTAGVLLTNKRQAFTKGFLTNLLNPKALVFFASLMSSLIPISMSWSGKGVALMVIWSLSLFWFASLAWLLTRPNLQRKMLNAGRYIDLLCGVFFSLLGGFILWQVLAG
ncbi:LysE family translocator [Marinomonas fungiae]|uniref:Threonine/homoserine/homoserine lactone efflux protein n=1 Tax=Marinomonas fungiae TaxID=1137284 RepID=A0A0K6IN44_9GAMM|nr:LysE family translocator [Marinomonas fungiae]CUB04511.1 Threonine/homoserine/homoserine lactone efflux protein [Marinomonas fungiae]